MGSVSRRWIAAVRLCGCRGTRNVLVYSSVGYGDGLARRGGIQEVRVRLWGLQKSVHDLWTGDSCRGMASSESRCSV